MRERCSVVTTRAGPRRAPRSPTRGPRSSRSPRMPSPPLHAARAFAAAHLTATRTLAALRTTAAMTFTTAHPAIALAFAALHPAAALAFAATHATAALAFAALHPTATLAFAALHPTATLALAALHPTATWPSPRCIPPPPPGPSPRPAPGPPPGPGPLGPPWAIALIGVRAKAAIATDRIRKACMTNLHSICSATGGGFGRSGGRGRTTPATMRTEARTAAFALWSPTKFASTRQRILGLIAGGGHPNSLPRFGFRDFARGRYNRTNLSGGRIPL